jgi:2-polyprenyl-3-methyl-5-hydroxy-6-metoxy-1,4-benzoquinol methylase
MQPQYCDGEMDYSRYYKRWHDGSKEHFRKASGHDYKVLKPYLSAKDAKILDLGCGMGFALGGLSSAGFTNCWGIDSDRTQVEHAQAQGLRVQMVEPEKTIDYIRCNAPFDFIFSLDVLEHIPTAALLPLLREIRDALKPGASFVCRVPNCDSLVAGRYRYNDWTHQTQFGDASLDFVLYNAGFQNIRISPSPDSLSIRPQAVLAWLLRRVLRGIHRAELMSELGYREASQIPLSPNIWGVAYAP